MFKMEIALDESKIKDAGQFSVEEITRQLDTVLQSQNLKKTGDGVFVGSGTPQDFAYFGNAINTLKKQSWFMPYVTKWLWYTNKGCEDVAAHYSHRA